MKPPWVMRPPLPGHCRSPVRLGLGRALPPDAAPAEIGATVMSMLDDEALRAACRAFAARVDRFGDLARAAALVEACAVGV